MLSARSFCSLDCLYLAERFVFSLLHWDRRGAWLLLLPKHITCLYLITSFTASKALDFLLENMIFTKDDRDSAKMIYGVSFLDVFNNICQFWVLNVCVGRVLQNEIIVFFIKMLVIWVIINIDYYFLLSYVLFNYYGLVDII